MATLARTTQWFLDRLEDVTEVADGWMARCPAHDDHTPSLHLTRTPSATGGVLVYCHAGCAYRDIIDALDDGAPNPQVRKLPHDPRRGLPAVPHPDARAWWEHYTGVDASLWEAWGVVFRKDAVAFTWEGLPVEKQRVAGTKQFRWTPEGASSPPLWPAVPEHLPARIYLTEGESDVGVARAAGLPAWALTKGAAAKKPAAIAGIWHALRERGVSEVVFILDMDEAGEKGITTYTRQARTAGLIPMHVTLRPFLDPLLGETDLRDVWMRVRDPYQMRAIIEQNTMIGSSVTGGRVGLTEFMQMYIEDVQWRVADVLLPQTVGMLVGAPKMGKTWVALDLGVSIATGTKFLDTFEVPMPGPVVYIMKEDPNYLLHDRLTKILLHKGLGGQVDLPHVSFPPNDDIPFYMDLNRDFVFDDAAAESLLDWLREIKAMHGEVALVILDPILRMMVGNPDNEFKATEINRSVFTVAERIRSEIGASVLLVHHRAKGQTEGKSSYGSVAFHAFSEGTLYLLGDEPDREGWVAVRGEYKSAPETMWYYQFEDLKDTYTPNVSTETKAPSRRDAIRDLIVLALKEGRAMSMQEIIDEVQAPEATVRAVVKALETSGEIVRDKDQVVKGAGRRKDVFTVPVDFSGI